VQVQLGFYLGSYGAVPGKRQCGHAGQGCRQLGAGAAASSVRGGAGARIGLPGYRQLADDLQELAQPSFTYADV